MKTLGVCTLDLFMDGVRLSGEFHISECSETGILGMNILSQQNVNLNIGRRRLFIRNKAVRLFDFKGSPFVNKVTSARTVHIAPGQECITPGRMRSYNNCKSKTVTLEPASLVYKKTGALVARIALKTDAPIVPVRIFNPTDDTITVFQNTTLGLLTDVIEERPWDPTADFGDTTKDSTCVSDGDNGEPPELIDIDEDSYSDSDSDNYSESYSDSDRNSDVSSVIVTDNDEHFHESEVT